MYWKSNHQSSPQIETVLSKDDLTLNDILDQVNILQELKSPNNKLIEFITRSDILDELISLIIEEPGQDLNEHERYKLPNLACEVLTTNIPRVNESLANTSMLTKLYSFLEKDPPLNPLLASYFSRTLSLLIGRSLDRHWYSYQFTCLNVLDFMKSRDDSLKLLLKHLGTSAIMDLTLKLLTQVEGDDMQRNLIDWLEAEEFMTNIIDLFQPSLDSERHYNAAELLCDTIRKCREQDANVKDTSVHILDSLQSPEMVQRLLSHMLDGELSESCITNGISVLLTLLEPSTPTPSPQHPALPLTVSAIVAFLPKLHNLLIDPPKKASFSLSSGLIDPPLGNSRLAVIKLIAALISRNVFEVNQKLDELNTVQVLLDLFFRYTWNNFLHSQVEKCLAFALNSAVAASEEQNPLICNIFIKCRLLQRILEAWEDNETEQGKGGKRKGYMGHLIIIANSVAEHVVNLSEFLKGNMDPDTMISWDCYVGQVLRPVIELQGHYLGGCHPSQNSHRDDDSDYSVPFDSQNNNDDDPYTYDALNTSKNTSQFFAELLSETDREMSAQGEDEKRTMFEKLCSSRTASTDLDGSNDDDEAMDSTPSRPKMATELEEPDEEIWEDYPTSSDEDDEKPIQDKMESIWSAPIAEPSDPWGKNGTDAHGNSDGWANFESVTFEQTTKIEEASPEKKLECAPANLDVPASELVADAVETVVQNELSSTQDNDSLHNDIDGKVEVIKNESLEDDDQGSDRPPEVWAAGDGEQNPSPPVEESDNNANLKSLKEESSQNRELYSKILSAKNKVNERIDDIPNSVDETPLVENSSDSSSQPAVEGEEGTTKTGSPPEPV